MSFRDTLRTVVNYEDIDGMGEGVEFDAQDPAAMDQIEAMEAEVELVEAENELDNDIKGMDDGDAMAETADAEVAAAEEVVAEADAKAAETGEAPAVPVEDVVASQEALKALIRQSGIEYNGVFASREDLYSNSYAAYTANLEGLKEIGGKIKEGLKKIWEKIKAGFKWIVAQIKKVLPTKLNRIKWLVNKIREFNPGTQEKDVITKAQTAFRKDYSEKYGAVSKLCGANFGNIEDYTNQVLKDINNTATLVDSVKMVKDDDGFKAVIEKLDKIGEFEKKGSEISAIIIKLQKELADKLTGLTSATSRIIGISAKGTIIKGTFKVNSTDTDGGKRVDIISVTTTDNTLNDVTFAKDSVISSLNKVLVSASKISAAGDKLNAAIEKAASAFGEAEGKNATTKWYYGRKAEKAIRKLITDQISCLTTIDGGVLSYALTYGKATLSALKDAKKNK